VPPLDARTEDEKRRYSDAGHRREIREAEARRRHIPKFEPAGPVKG
jgi:hypothetical protein